MGRWRGDGGGGVASEQTGRLVVMEGRERDGERGGGGGAQDWMDWTGLDWTGLDELNRLPQEYYQNTAGTVY